MEHLLWKLPLIAILVVYICALEVVSWMYASNFSLRSPLSRSFPLLTTLDSCCLSSQQRSFSRPLSFFCFSSFLLSGSRCWLFTTLSNSSSWWNYIFAFPRTGPTDVKALWSKYLRNADPSLSQVIRAKTTTSYWRRRIETASTLTQPMKSGSLYVSPCLIESSSSIVHSRRLLLTKWVLNVDDNWEKP